MNEYKDSNLMVDLTKKVYTPEEAGFILDRLEYACQEGIVEARSESTPSLLSSYRGVEEKGITPKWNVKVYGYNKKKGGHSVVCIDMHVLGRLLEADYESFVPPDLKVLRIDDAGGGFPLCGVMVGISDEGTVQTAVVPVEYFRNDTDNAFETKRYLDIYQDLAVRVLQRFDASPSTHRIEICSGHINQPLRDKLRRLGYDVRVTEIKGMLQDTLEELYREYVNGEVGSDVYYDPKGVKVSEIPTRYRAALEYGRKHCPDKIKTGWNSPNKSGNRSNRRAFQIPG